MEYYVTKPADYWIANNAVNITLNALGEKNRIQGSVASGAVIMCFVDSIRAEGTPGGEPGNGDGLWYGSNHEPKRWPLSLSPTYFNSDTHKYVYVAIPRSTSVGTQAVIVFPSEELDIYGRAKRVLVNPETGEPVLNDDGEQQDTYAQIGSTDYFYVWLNGIIGAADEVTVGIREWEDPITDREWGLLETAQGRDEQSSSSEWYTWSSVNQVVTFLKEIIMKEGSSFRNLILNKKNLTDVATSALLAPIDSDTAVATPGYVAKFYLSKFLDDVAHGRITFEKGLEFMTTLIGIDNEGNRAREGFLDGYGIFMDANQGLIETDGLNVRGFMRIMELIINRLQLMESDYSFTEGDTVEHVDYEDGGQTLVLTMHRDHDNDYTPFYPGDIIYGIKNDLLSHSEQTPEGHIKNSNASYFRTWMRVKSVDLSTNQLRVTVYPGKKPNGNAMVPGGSNFSPYGTQIKDADITAEMTAEYNTHINPEDPTSPILGEVGFDTALNVTRHGNVADGINPDTGEYDEHIHQSQLGRQQAWVLSTTDKRLSFFWNVDEPIVRDENYALCLGILPDLANLPSTRNKNMPSLYVNTVFYDHQHRANYPAKVVKVDRGQWVSNPVAEYLGETGTYTPDGTLVATDPDLANYLNYVATINSYAGSYEPGLIREPYHYRTITKAEWLTYRLDTFHYGSRSDKSLLLAMLEEWKEEVDLEVSRTWNKGALWECLVDGTTQDPWFGCADWQMITGTTFSLGFFSDGEDPVPILGISVRPGNIDETVKPYLLFGQEDICNIVTSWQWERESSNAALDEAWKNSAHVNPEDPTSPLKSQTRTLHITDDDLPDGWFTSGGRVGFKCTAVFMNDGEETEMINMITIV